jgi:hypothetical protein
MSKLDLRVRDLRTGETMHATFEHEDDARVWLQDRPHMVEVLGVATHGLPREVYAMLRAAGRPLNSAEQALRDKFDEAAAREAREREAEAQRREAAEQEEYRRAMQNADPDRPMQLRFARDGGVTHQDSVDQRPIPEAARAAVLAWVAEREEWVRDRGQVVDEAQLVVWPGALPEGTTERVEPGGQFWPAPAPTRA